MKRLWFALVLVLFVPVVAHAGGKVPKGAAWHMNATVIEACSCPMFCQCYFNPKPSAHGAGHGGHGESAGHEGHDHGAPAEDHFCRFNNAYKINQGHHGSTKLNGALFWIYGDLGGDFSKGEMDWAVVTFDKATTPDQRKAIGEICAALFPVKWNSLTTAEGSITWVPGKEKAHALLDEGRTAELRLDGTGLQRDDKSAQMVLHNLKYWGANWNEGFVMMPNTIETVRTGDKAFEFKGTNGFMVTFDIFAPPAGGGGN